MPQWIKLGITLFLALAALPISTASLAQTCPDPSNWHLTEAGKLIMTVNPTLPPQEFVNEKGELLGLNIDLTTAIAKRLCLEPVYIRMDAQGQVPGMRAGRFDMVNNGLFWTAERTRIIFMVPYAQHGFSILTAPGSPLKITKFADLAGLRAGAEVTSYPDVMAHRDNAALVASGGKSVDLHGFPNGPEALAALRAGQVDAIFTLDETAASIEKRGGAKVQAVGLWSAEITLAFRDRQLAQASADVLTALRAEGLYDRLFDQWGMHRLEGKIFAIRE